MLKNAKQQQLFNLKLNIFTKQNSILLKPFFFFIPWLLSANSASAANEVLGVVKSQENANRWQEITARLHQSGVKYCTVDVREWQSLEDLGDVEALLLPNVETIDNLQAESLQQWMNRGGKVIVAGATGNSSSFSVKEQLHSLFGAYWQSDLATAPLRLTADTPVEWYGRSPLARTFSGGKLIPTNNSQTAAIWKTVDEPAAAVVTENSIFLGWQWGDSSIPASLDRAWITAALDRYDIETNRLFVPTSFVEPKPCQTSKPLLFPSQEPTQSLLPESRFGFRLEPALSDEQVTEMTSELTGLIGRFEASLLTANARESDIDLSTSKVIEQLLSRKTKNIERSALAKDRQSSRVLKTAKDNLQQFAYLIEKRNYTQAKQLWLDARNALWDNYPTDRHLAQTEVRAMWLDRGTIVKAKSKSDLARVFDRMAQAGINTVFFETVNAGYTIYPSQVAPEQNPLTKYWDPLQAAVELAHERGMELHAWVWAFAAVNQRHNVILNLPERYLGPILSRFPNWATSDRGGERFHYNSGKVFLDPANSQVKLYLSQLLEEIATRYEVDGIHLDYVRYPFQSPTGTLTYGYGMAARQQFFQQTGVDPMTLQPGDRLWSQWTGFRIRQIDNFIFSASQKLKQQRPELIISTAVFPMPRLERLNKIQQNWEEWIEQGWIDMLVPMTYALDTERLQKLAGSVVDSYDRSKALLLPGIRLLNVPNVVAVDQTQLLRGMSTEGFALFAAENLNPTLERVFSRTNKSSNTDSEPLPFRQPFQATLSRYQSLQREWNFTIDNDRLAIKPITLKQWGESADELAIDLERLAEEPSTKNLFASQVALASFRRQFSQWMKETKSIAPYQAEVWQNRLNTLDRLLSYGEKKLPDSEEQTFSN
ncbi:glycoside hydrolase family 10 protein [Myxosarcina sp. GI1]|uniref:glycoside hydrolase family 10 protein n=1 Tax=Myxosarcina sp. GI1 TaxID=1541065 RepID=UPI00056C2D4E|nr:family 10 glycosylhydrolase [Myxosarcina sp. GI1]